jgi:hypothetical protein
MASGPTGFQATTIKQMLTEGNEPSVKKYYKYDSGGNVTDIYYAQATALENDKCLRQRLAYDTVSGVAYVTKESWETDEWGGSAWEI